MVEGDKGTGCWNDGGGYWLCGTGVPPSCIPLVFNCLMTFSVICAISSGGTELVSTVFKADVTASRGRRGRVLSDIAPSLLTLEPARGRVFASKGPWSAAREMRSWLTSGLADSYAIARSRCSKALRYGHDATGAVVLPRLCRA